MASDAIFEFINTFFLMLLFSLFLIVSVTVVAGVFDICARVTGLAFDFSFVAMIQRERVISQMSRHPGCRGVAAGTVKAKIAGVHIWFFVAADAFARCPSQNSLGVTTLTSQEFMTAFQRED